MGYEASMALIVQKFGGTSVGSVERIKNVAERVLETQMAGHQVVVVVSAMSGETNRLVGLAREIAEIPDSAAFDLLVASGEQVTVGLLSLAINQLAASKGLIVEGQEYKSRGLLGFQIGIMTDKVYSKARIQTIKTEVIERELEKGAVPIIAGFQGVDSDNNITTLGRGGSDTSAVAIAAALKADECEIYTDVDGVYTCDPRLCSEATKLSQISYEEMMELAGSGAKVLQIRSVELAAKFRLQLHVRSSFERSEGTRVVSIQNLGQSMEQVVVAGVALDKDQMKFTLQNVPDRPGVAAEVFGRLSDQSVVVDVIALDVSSNGKLTVSFTVGQDDQAKTQKVLSALQASKYSEMQVVTESDLAKVTIVGAGMQHHPGVASKMFELLARQNINIKLITTSEIKVSCLIEQSQAKDAVEVLHRGFELDKLC